MIQKILVVDDELSIRKTLKDALSMEDYEVRTAKDAENALKQLNIQKFDLVISDIKMPKVDGLELLQLIRQQFPKVYVMLMSGHGDHETEIKAKSMGASHFIPKPLDLMYLLDLLEGDSEAF